MTNETDVLICTLLSRLENYREKASHPLSVRKMVTQDATYRVFTSKIEYTTIKQILKSIGGGCSIQTCSYESFFAILGAGVIVRTTNQGKQVVEIMFKILRPTYFHWMWDQYYTASPFSYVPLDVLHRTLHRLIYAQEMNVEKNV